LRIPDVSDMDALSAALAYAQAGWYVLPVKKGSKHPGSVVGNRWHLLSSCEPDVIVSWFAGTDHGVALHLGRSGAVAFDVDDAVRMPEVLARAIVVANPPRQSTRAGDASRAHYVFAQCVGRMIGNGGGALGTAWGEVRGRNGVIVVEPSLHLEHASGGRYEWTQVGALPTLPPQLAEALPESTVAVDAATDAEVLGFLNEQTASTRPELLEIWCHLFLEEVESGGSRHQAMVSKAVGALKEAAAGLLDARTVAGRLESLFLSAVGQPPRSDRQGRARVGPVARSEWAGILSWAVAQATAADPGETLARVAEKVPAGGQVVQGPAENVARPIALEEAHSVFVRWLGADYDLDVLDAVLVAAAVERLDGDPAWLLVVSGSGAAKTETVAALAAAGACVTSTIASEGALLSGTSRRGEGRPGTGGLLRKLGASGVLVIKDVTSILSMHRDVRASVLAALREVYDGRWERNVGSEGGQSLTWTGRLVVIGAVTTAWDRAHEVVSSMGDRFVLIRFDSSRGRVESGRRAIANTGQEETMRAELGRAAAGALAGVNRNANLSPTDAETTTILALADIVTRSRTGVEHDYRGEVIDAHAPEMPTRFAKQLTQILRGGIALGMERAGAMELVRRCALDSIPPLRLAVLRDVAAHPNSKAFEVRSRVDKPRTTVTRTLEDLHMLGMLTLREAQEGERDVAGYSVPDGVDMRILVTEKSP
jgi:hypothetical protein